MSYGFSEPEPEPEPEFVSLTSQKRESPSGITIAASFCLC
jgi:hypothetical protein